MCTHASHTFTFHVCNYMCICYMCYGPVAKITIKFIDIDIGSKGLKNQQFALCSIVENFASTPFLYLLVVPEASLKDDVFKFIVSCALDNVLVI